MSPVVKETRAMLMCRIFFPLFVLTLINQPVHIMYKDKKVWF